MSTPVAAEDAAAAAQQILDAAVARMRALGFLPYGVRDRRGRTVFTVERILEPANLEPGEYAEPGRPR